jgi:hypothetical protein
MLELITFSHKGATQQHNVENGIEQVFVSFP